MANTYKLSPSASSRFLTCTASLPFNLEMSDSKVTLEGTLMHEVAGLRLEQFFNNVDHTERLNEITDYNHPYKSRNNEKLVVYWMPNFENIVSTYIDYVKRVAEQFNAVKVYVEYRVKMRWYNNNINGMIDIAMVDKDNNIFIIDLKTGRNKVDTDDNSQMLMYGYGFMQAIYKETKELPKTITISISQPLIHNTQAVEYQLVHLLDWYKEQRQSMREINTGELKFRPNPKACKYCGHRLHCKARVEAGVS